MSDPQYCRGGPEAVARVAEWMRLCACGHPQVEHDIIDAGKKKGQRSGCLTTEGKTKCGCTLYKPPSEGSDEETAGPVAPGPATSPQQP